MNKLSIAEIDERYTTLVHQYEQLTEAMSLVLRTFGDCERHGFTTTELESLALAIQDARAVCKP